MPARVGEASMSGNVERRTAGGLGLLGYQGVALDIDLFLP
jgi:hypothetical protein